SRDLAGTLVLVGVPTPEMRLEMPLLDFFSHGGALKSSWYGDCLPSRDFPMLIDLYRQGRLDLDRFVSATITIDEVEDAFRAFCVSPRRPAPRAMWRDVIGTGRRGLMVSRRRLGGVRAATMPWG